MLAFILGRKFLQVFFVRLHRFALKGLNYNRASDYANNGEAFALKSISSMLRQPSVVIFDVGANVGHYTLELLRAFGDTNIRLFAFEPSQKVFEQLKSAVGVHKGVQLIPMGMSNEMTTATLHTREGASGLSSLYDRNLTHRDLKLDQKETIQLTTLDLFCADQKIDRIDFLKMDVEGHEISVLKGATGLLSAGRISIIQFEFGGCNIDSRTYFRDFYDLLSGQFRLHRILADGFAPIDRYDERLEIFQSANYLAVHRSFTAWKL